MLIFYADADICLPSNVYMSNKHCFVYRDKDGIVWLEDCRYFYFICILKNFMSLHCYYFKFNILTLLHFNAHYFYM